ncbi:hypothetical protein NX059_002889 [Plenodomus lindquistii]|nr:hypothetical protein NX059_002889 [Plenodomus lindquistii]
MRSTIILATLSTFTLAQDAISTLSVPFIGWYPESEFGDAIARLEGSVVSANAQATTVELTCASKGSCALFPKETIVYGPSTYNIDMSDPSTDFTATIDCALGSPWITCKETAGGSEANFPGSSTTSYEASSLTQVPVSITAGTEKLNGVEAASTGAASSQAAVSTGATSAGAQSALSSMTPSARSGSASGSVIASQTSAAAATASTGAAAANVVASASGLIGAAAGVFVALLL